MSYRKLIKQIKKILLRNNFITRTSRIMNRIDMLNNGLEATTHLNECLQVDQEHLFKVILTPFCNEQLLNKMLSVMNMNNTASGILSKMKIIGKVLADTFISYNIQDEIYRCLSQHISDTARGWACFILPEKKPPLSLEELLIQIQPYAKDNHFGVREWAWMAVREKLCSDLTVSIELLSSWVTNPNPYIRRFAVECLRPRGVWCKHITELKTQPDIALPLLEPLKNESEKYVQDSVANWLNDASKTRPNWVSDLCERWVFESNTEFTKRIVKKAMRTINMPLKGK